MRNDLWKRGGAGKDQELARVTVSTTAPAATHADDGSDSDSDNGTAFGFGQFSGGDVGGGNAVGNGAGNVAKGNIRAGTNAVLEARVAELEAKLSAVKARPFPPILLRSNPHSLFYEVVSVHRCVLPWRGNSIHLCECSGN